MESLRAAALLLSLASALAAGMSLCGAFSARLDVLTHLTPITLAVALFALALAAVGGDVRTAGLAFAAAGVCLALMIPECLPGRQARRTAEVGERLKIVQFNLWQWNADPAATVTWIERQAADIVVVQEALGAARDIPSALAHLYPHRVPDISIRSSTLILAKIPPRQWGVLPAPVSSRKSMAPWACFGKEADGFTVAAVHLAWPIPAGRQRAQRLALVAELRRFDPARLILAGDFNSTPWSFALRRLDATLGLLRRTRRLATWPARQGGRFPLNLPFVVLPIDHIYAGSAWDSVSAERGPRLGSDHLPVVVTLARRQD
jgi:endonuclease/exonuclease/phosphatase (EEP) superfamily protein YafD